MTRSTEERLLAFLEGRMDGPEREAFLDKLDADPVLAERLRSASVGLDHLQHLSSEPGAPRLDTAALRPRGVPSWWIPVAVAATLALAVPGTLMLAPSGRASTGPVANPSGASTVLRTGMPEGADASYMLVLHGRWPDAATVPAQETQRRAEEYWGWTSALATSGFLVAAGDLRWEPGERLGPEGAAMQVAANELDEPEYLVGIITLRVSTYEEALALARDCPHLKYGGSVSVRRVGAGFVTVPDMDDWTQ